MEMNEIIKVRRAQLGLTLDDIAKAVGVSGATVQRWENGVIANMRRDKIAKLAKVLKTSPAYLMGWIDDPDGQKSEDLPDNIIPLKKARYIPLIGRIACGTPILAEQNIVDRILLPEGVNANFALTCKGNSMIGAGISDGDIVFVKQQPEVETGEIGVAFDNDHNEATLKKIYRSDGALTLMAANPEVPPIVYSGAQIKNIKILGKAVAVLKML